MRLPDLILTLVALLVSQGCTIAAVPVTAAVSAADPESTIQKLRTTIGTADCTSNAQCHSMAVGAKACGGPELYLPWSSTTTSATILQPLADRYHAERRAQISANGEISTCSMALAPGAMCNPTGHCVLQTGPAGATADPR